MKKISIILIALFLVLVFAAPYTALAEDLISAAAHAEDFSAARQKILKNTGIPCISGCDFHNWR